MKNGWKLITGEEQGEHLKQTNLKQTKRREMMRNSCTLFFVTALILAFVFPTPRDAHAVASWARRYNADCNMCHTLFPQLNKTGYIFRANGYRMPEEAAEEEEVKIGDKISVRGFFQWQNKNKASGTTPLNNAKNGFRLKEVQFFVAGPVEKSPLSYFGEFVFNEDGEEAGMIENYFLRYVKPGQTEGGFLNVKMGHFHTIEGYMGLDRPLVLTRPFVLGKTPSGVQTKAAWHDGRGVVLGYLKGTDVNKATTSLNLAILNGLGVEDGSASGVPEDPQNRNSGYDLQFIGTQFLDDSNALSLYYYTGKSPQDDGAGTFTYENSYSRLGLFANFYPVEDINLQAGYLNRKEDSSTTASFDAKGWLLGADYLLKSGLWGSIRYDKWDPSDAKASDEQTGWLLQLAQQVATGTRATLQYETSKTTGKTSANTLTAELQVMW